MERQSNDHQRGRGVLSHSRREPKIDRDTMTELGTLAAEKTQDEVELKKIYKHRIKAKKSQNDNDDNGGDDEDDEDDDVD